MWHDPPSTIIPDPLEEKSNPPRLGGPPTMKLYWDAPRRKCQVPTWLSASTNISVTLDTPKKAVSDTLGTPDVQFAG
jgi:hypothetical protein